MGATMFGGSVFADTSLDAVQTLANQNSDKITDLTGRVSKLETASSGATQNTKDIAANTTAIAKNAGDIKTNTTAIAKNAGDIKTNTDNIAKNAGAITTNKKAIADEATARDQAVAQERAERKGADAAQDKVIQQVNQNVADGFKAINNNIGTITDQLNKNDLAEQQARAAKDTEHDNAIAANKQAISTTNTYVEQNMQGISDNRASIGKINGILNGTDGTGNSGLIKQVNDNTTGIAENKKAIADEAKTRAAEDTRLNTKMDKGFSYIDGQLVDHKNQIDKNKTDIQTNAGKIQTNTAAIKANSDKLTAHEERITNDESNIENNAETIKKVQGDVVDEVAARKAADQNLQIQINNNNTSVNNEAAERKAADQNLQNQINNNSTSINDLYGRYSSLKTDINKVGARSAALAGLHPLDFDPANKLNFAVASGSFKGENSVALGAFYRPNENIMFSAASTMGDSDNAYTFGLSFKIGPSSAKTKTTSPDAEELYKVVGELQDQLAAQQKEIEQLKADKAK